MKSPALTNHPYCLRAAKPYLSAKCLFKCFGREYGPSSQPSTGQGYGPLWTARCSRIVLSTLKSLPQVGQVNSSCVGGGPCLAFKWATIACFVVYPFPHSLQLCCLLPFPQEVVWSSNINLVDNTLPQTLQDQPVSPVWVFR